MLKTTEDNGGYQRRKLIDIHKRKIDNVASSTPKGQKQVVISKIIPDHELLSPVLSASIRKQVPSSSRLPRPVSKLPTSKLTIVNGDRKTTSLVKKTSGKEPPVKTRRMDDNELVIDSASDDDCDDIFAKTSFKKKAPTAIKNKSVNKSTDQSEVGAKSETSNSEASKKSTHSNETAKSAPKTAIPKVVVKRKKRISLTMPKSKQRVKNNTSTEKKSPVKTNTSSPMASPSTKIMKTPTKQSVKNIMKEKPKAFKTSKNRATSRKKKAADDEEATSTSTTLCVHDPTTHVHTESGPVKKRTTTTTTSIVSHEKRKVINSVMRNIVTSPKSSDNLEDEVIYEEKQNLSKKRTKKQNNLPQDQPDVKTETEDIDDGLRRSKRKRMPCRAYWEGDNLVKQEPESPTKITSAKMITKKVKKETTVASILRAMAVPVEQMDEEGGDLNEDEMPRDIFMKLPLDPQNPEKLTEFQVFSNLQGLNPVSKKEDDGFRFATTLTCPGFNSGLIRMNPDTSKGRQVSKNSILCFFIVSGKLEVEINGEKTVLGTGHQFVVPQGVRYDLRNCGTKPVLLQYHSMDKTSTTDNYTQTEDLEDSSE